LRQSGEVVVNTIFSTGSLESRGRSLMIERKLSQLSAELLDNWRKILWRFRNGTAPETTPIFIVGSQRSGTGMLGQVLGKSPEIENLGESDPRAFEQYFIRPDETVDRVIRECKCRFMVFKPLKDSERIHHFLARYPASKALWAYRFYADRINSAVKEFGRHPLDVFEAFADGRRDAWQLRRIDPQVERVVRRFDPRDLTPHEGAALMWWVRNSLYFSLGLEKESRVRLWSYDQFVRNPERELVSLLDFLGARKFSFMLSDVHGESYRKDVPPELRGEIRELCQSLYDRLESASARQSSRQVEDHLT
jgi:hypothetical protein